MNVPLVSVIIPVYNSEKFIIQTLESVLAQTWTNLEIIVVDDGSTDGSFELINKIETDRRLKILKQENSGASAARNVAFQNCNGEFIQYLDADDLISPNKIQSQMDVLLKSPEGTIASSSWAIFNSTIEDAKPIIEDTLGDFTPIDWLIIALHGGGMMPISGWLTPKSIIKIAGPWNTSLTLHDDGEFFCRVLLNSRFIKYCESAITYYRSHSGPRISKEYNRKSIESALLTYISYEENLLTMERSRRTSRAIASGYATFLYEFYDSDKEFAHAALKRLKDQGCTDYSIPGGKYFRMFAAVFGFTLALKIRSVLRKLTQKLS